MNKTICFLSLAAVLLTACEKGLDVEEDVMSSAIALREGKSHGDLMTAKATATLVDGGTNTVTLGMERKTMLIQSVEIKKVPTAATADSSPR